MRPPGGNGIHLFKGAYMKISHNPRNVRTLVLCALCLFGVTACGGGSSGGTSTSSSSGGSGGGSGATAGSAGFVFVSNPNSGRLDSYGYTSSGTIGSLAGYQNLPSFQGTVGRARPVTDPTDSLVFVTTNGSSTNEEWSYVYSATTGLMSGGLSNTSVATQGTPQGMPIDPIDHFGLSVGTTGIDAFAYNTSTGALASTSTNTTFTTSNVVTADLLNHWLFVVSGTTLSDYAINPTTEAISTTPTSSVTISALSGATNVDNDQDVAHGILFLIIQGANTSLVPVPYNVTTGIFGTPAATTGFSGTVSSPCSDSNNVDPTNNLLFLQNNSTGAFGIYAYNSSTGAIGAAAMPFTSLPIAGGCAALDTSNRLLFFLNNSTASAPYGLISATYPTTGASVTQVNGVNGMALGTLTERATTTHH